MYELLAGARIIPPVIILIDSRQRYERKIKTQTECLTLLPLCRASGSSIIQGNMLFVNFILLSFFSIF